MAMTPEQWNLIMEYSTNMQQVRNTVAREVRLHLGGLPEDETLTTNQLVEALYPRATAERTLAGDNARMRIYKMVAKLALNGLEDCCRKGEGEKKFMGKIAKPWLWFNPGNLDVCYACGQIMPPEFAAPENVG